MREARGSRGADHPAPPAGCSLDCLTALIERKMNPFLIGAYLLLWVELVLGNNTEVCGQRPLVDTLGSRIIGGHDALPGAWPWQVSLQYFIFGKGYKHLCGGSLIHKMWVMTAAHCFTERRNHRYWRAVFGVNNIFNPDDTKQISEIKRIMSHRNFDSVIMDNDLALLELADPVTFTDYILPVCLATWVHVDPLAQCFITGWGKTSTRGEMSDILQEAQIDRIPTSLCNSSGWYNGLITDNMICAGFEDGGIDTCQGDSGGPFVCYIAESARFYQVGITSFGYGCAEAQYPGVYTRVENYANWMKNAINQSDDGIHAARGLVFAVKICLIHVIGTRLSLLTTFM